MGFDYLQLNDGDFNARMKLILQYCNGKCSGSSPEWTHIPAAVLVSVGGVYAAYYTAYSACLEPHTPVETEAKNDAKKAAKKALRAFVNQYLRFPPVTDEDRTAMGIPNRDTHPTPGKKPKDIPETEVRMPKPRVLEFRFRRAGNKRWGKPDDVHGMELKWLITDTQPARIEELTGSEFATKSPLVMNFEEDQRGKRLYYIVRWETNTVLKGDFSEILLAIVP
jgi:hypothetical protein